jgi:MarR family transcriptional regulator, lower aerobic nicotinate degradation pathway regulator
MDLALPTALTGHAGYLGVVMGQRSQEKFEVAMATLDLRPVHYDVLATLAERGPMAQRQLADLLDIDPGRVVALIDDLEARGLVARTVDPDDRRRNLLTLTKDGRSLTMRAARLAVAVEKDLLEALDESERVRLRALLQKALSLGQQ